MVAGGMRIGHEDGRQAVRGDLEHGPAGAGDHQVCGREGIGEVRHLEVLAQVVSGSGLPPGQLRVVTASADVQHAKPGAREGLERRPVDRAGSQRAAEHEHARLIGRDAQTLACRADVVVDGGHRPAGDAVAAAVAAGEGKGEAHAPGERGQHAVGQPEPAVRLGENHRNAQRERGQPHRAGDIAAAAHDRLRVDPRQHRPCAR